MAFNFNVKEIESADIQQSASLSIMMKKIIELPETISRKISTGQVIITLTGACRELIDNSLDANATNIEIRVKENGTESLEVLDNGSGISVENFEQLCRPHCTSKLADLDDFNSLNSYGFRGEALNALATLSDVQIVTRDAESRCAWQLCFGRNGEILNREQCSRQQGTTISVLHLFKLLPVRRQEFLRNSRREFLKLVECVQAFALSHPNCRFTLSNIVNGKRSQHLISPGGSATLPEVIGSLFGVGIGHKNELLELEEVVVPSEEVEHFYGIAHKNDQNITEKIYQNTRLSGFISNCEPGQGRSNSDRQFIFVNRRHIDYPKLCRIANEIYGAYNRGQFPILVLFIDVPPSIIDVNISPDKRIVLFHHEKELFAKFRATLLATFTKVQGACPAATMSSINQFQQKPITKAIQQFGKNSPKLDKEAEKSFNLDENQIDIPQYSVFMHEASNSAINSTFIGEEENFIMDLDKSNENEDIVEREECSTTKTAEIVVSPNANESAFFHENSFNPDDSRNLRDSFVLAESTPKMVDRTRGSPIFDGITPIRRNFGFQSAASLFKEANNTEDERNQQNGNGFGGFQTAAKLFQKSGKSFEIVSEKLNQKENCHHKSAHFPTFSQIDGVDAEIQLESPMKRAKLLELYNENANKTPQNNPNICQQFPSTSTAVENDCNSPSPSPSLLLSPNSSIFEEEDIPTASSSSIPCSNSGISIGRPHQKIVVNLQNLRRRFEMFRKEINEEENKKKKNDEEENIPIIEEAELNFNEKNEEIVKREIERKLSLMLKKSDFGRMKLIGQFNNAFLIGRLGHELFIIDQHAADEKFNFECLQEKMAVKSQKLINAQKLKLGTVNVAILKDNLELFRKNGFDFKFEAEEEEDETKSGFVQLISTPNINGYHFDKHDIDQLISLISELPGQLHRPNKIRAIFASKACRKSVMFGQALADSKMEEIIKNMGQMAAPWNCPHGRPTIRHLCTIHTNKII